MRQVKCNRCGYIGDESEFPKGRDFLQNKYVAQCASPECDNRQSPGNASMRAFGGDRPFEFVDRVAPTDPLDLSIHRMEEAA